MRRVGRALPLSHPSGTIRSMGAVWLGVAVAVVAGIVALLRRSSAGGKSADVDAGSVSESWLSEERGRKDS
jgi:hypothetical protein